ncbi:MAG TPA: glycosyltransferase family 39 protein [Streptosporangiaceae bacterium]
MAEAWAMWSILAAQATLTLPWMWRTGAYSDEALYLTVARQGWKALLGAAPNFPGLPVIYPPVAGFLDSIGGTIAARIPSLLFMLGATALVYHMGDRMFGRMSGVLAALLFAVCGIIVHLGAAATFDPMALFLLVLALHAAVRMRDGGIGWLVLCPLALAAANATKYATTAWDPLIIGTIVLYGWSKGRLQSLFLAVSVAVSTAMIDAAVLMLGGTNLAYGVVDSLIRRSPQAGLSSSALSVLAHALLMTGLIVLIALAGIWVSVVKRMPATATAFLCLLVLGAVLVPVDQARLHQITSLDENMGFGLPFAALAAGYALGAWRQWLGRQRHWGKIVATTAAVVTVITMLIVGRVERVQFRGPAAEVASSVWPVVGGHFVKHSMILDDGSSTVGEYYLPGIPPTAWRTFYGTPSDYTRRMVKGHCFSVVMIDASDANSFPHLRRILHNYGYQRLTTNSTVSKRVLIWSLPKSQVTLTASVKARQSQKPNPCG